MNSTRNTSVPSVASRLIVGNVPFIAMAGVELPLHDNIHLESPSGLGTCCLNSLAGSPYPKDNRMITFGPIPSRRLGQSLGINNIQPKVCTYSCIYCQLGGTTKMKVGRGAFYDPAEILKAVKGKIKKTMQMGGSVDYLTFVPDGEPTLDINLGHEIEDSGALGIKTAVISNASLIWREDVREDLMRADWVSLKVDSADNEIWRRMNRPQGTLRLESILDGIVEFGKSYKGKLTTETMLIKGVNDGADHVSETADFLAELRPWKAYLSIPTRPPAEKWVQPPNEDIISRAYRILQKRIGRVECLMEYEGNAFAFTGDVVKDLLGITAVHPMRKDAVQDFLEGAEAHWSLIERLMAENQLSEIEYGGQKFYRGKFPKQSTANKK